MPGTRCWKRLDAKRGARGPGVRTWSFALTLGGALLLLASPARGSDPQPYTVSIASTSLDSLDDALNGSSQLVSLRETAPVSPFALIGRAREDGERLKTVLESFGYYQGKVAITILQKSLDDPDLPDAIVALTGEEKAPVAVTIDLGPLYHLRTITLDGEVSTSERAALALSSGEPAYAIAVLDAQARLLNRLEEDGYAFATVDTPIAYEIPEATALDITFHIVRGEKTTLGPITLVGLKRVEETLVRTRLLIRQGQPYSPSKIEEARRDLLALGVFSSVTVKSADHPDEAGQVPVTVSVQERLRHTLGFNAAYSSDLGGSAGVRWTDRDLLGGAEQLTLTASAIDIGGHATSGLGYNVGAQFTKPDYGARDENLQINATTLKQSLDAYDQTAVTSSVLLTHRFSPFWMGSIGLSGEREQITQQLMIRDYTLLGVPVAARFNDTGVTNPLQDTLHGIRASISVTPTRSFTAIPATFVIAQADAAMFYDLNALGVAGVGRSVIALRAVAGQAHGAAPFDLPPDQRFYGGGSGTIRGFVYQSVGPTFPGTVTPQGGTAVDAATVEFRQRIAKTFGAVLFVDAGAVSADGHLLQGKPSVGVGTGFRYYTPIGPIRLDVAVPVKILPGGDPFVIYIGLGQAF